MVKKNALDKALAKAAKSRRQKRQPVAEDAEFRYSLPGRESEQIGHRRPGNCEPSA